MKKLIPYIVALSSACLFFACGDDTSSKNDSGLSTVGNVSELPECEAANAGQMIYVADSGAVFFCNTTFWKNLSGNNGIDGILCKAEDIDELANGINSLIDNEDTRRSMGKKAAINIQRFSMDHIMNQWDVLFQEIRKRHANEA